MKRNNSQLAHLALGMLMVLLGACTPSSLITPARQTAVAATGMAAANSALTATTGDQSPAPSATMVSGSSAKSSPAVPVTGSTAFPATVTPVPATTTAPNATSGANTAVGSATPAPTGTSGTTGSGGIIPNTGATSTVSGSSTSTVGSATGCGGLLNVGAAGQSATLWIKNDTNGPLNFTMGLASANTLGQCGYMTWGPIKAGQNLRVAVPSRRRPSAIPATGPTQP